MSHMAILMTDGKHIRRIHYVPNINGFGAHAWIRVGLFRKVHQYAAGENVIDNLVRRMEGLGWHVLV